MKFALAVLVLFLTLKCFSQVPAKIYRIQGAALKTVLQTYDSIDINISYSSGTLMANIIGYSASIPITGYENIGTFTDNNSTLPLNTNITVTRQLRCYGFKSVPNSSDWDFNPTTGTPYYLVPDRGYDAREQKFYLYYHITTSATAATPYYMSLNPIPPASPGHALLNH